MNLKSLLIFLTIFVIGFGSGFLVTGRLTKRSIEAVKERESPAGFKKDLYKYLNPDEKQKHIIDSIVADYIPKIKEERTISRMYQKHLRDSMFAEIQQLLNTKQKDNFKKFEKEKIIKKTQPTIAKQKDTVKRESLTSRQNRIAKFKESLTPEQKRALDTIVESRIPEPRNPEMRREIRQYTRDNIVPVLIQYRSEFDKELTDDEKTVIADLRLKRKALIKSELLGMDDAADKENQKAMIAEAKILLKNIIINHKASLEKIAISLQPEREKWEADIDKIRAKYIPDYKPGQNNLARTKEKNAIDFILMDSEKKPRRRF